MARIDASAFKSDCRKIYSNFGLHLSRLMELQYFVDTHSMVAANLSYDLYARDTAHASRSESLDLRWHIYGRFS